MGKARTAFLIGGAACLALIETACALYKPLRAATPELFGVTCISDDLCLEDPTRAPEADRLTHDALAFVAEKVAPLPSPPRVVFCSTRACFSRFGNPAVSALYVWGLDTVLINETGWQAHILRHEMIHHWQAAHIGQFRASRLPRWYIEGMAYTLSEDPRDPLPRDDIEHWREEFRSWVAEGNDWRVPPSN